MNPMELEERKLKALEEIADRLSRIEAILKETTRIVDEREVFRR